MEDNERMPADKLLERAEQLIERGELEEAQSLLDELELLDGRAHYVQSKLYAQKGWRKEQRIQLEYAINAEPANSEYRDALEKLIELESKIITDEEYYARVEAHLKENEPEFAQNDLNCVKEDSGRKHFLQSKIYKQKKWYNEQYKQLKKAIKAEPDNEEYRKELAELNEFKKSGDFKQYQKQIKKEQMGSVGNVCAEGCADGCCEGGCYCCCAAVCEGIGNGC